MNAEARIQLIDEMLHSTQVVRKNALGNEGRYVLNGAFADAYDRMPTDEEAEAVLTDLFPWLFGDKSIMLPLIKMAQRSQPPPTKQETYNVLMIAHRLEPIVKLAYEVYIEKKLPVPMSVYDDGMDD